MSLLMCIFLFLRAKIESSTLRTTYVKVCFINNLRFSKELSVISPVTRYWQKVRKWPDFYRAPGNSKGWSKFLCSCLWLPAPRAVCSGPLLAASSLVADGTEGKEHLSPTVCHLLPLTFTPLGSPPATLKPLTGHAVPRCCCCSGDDTAGAAAEGTAAGSGSLLWSLTTALQPWALGSPTLKHYQSVSWTQWKQISWLIHSWKYSSLSST